MDRFAKRIFWCNGTNSTKPPSGQEYHRMATHSSSEDRDNEALHELPPSAKLVYKTLQHEGEHTQHDLAETTRLAPRTVRNATTCLETNGLITSRAHLGDARKTVYSIAPVSHDRMPADNPRRY